MLTSRARETLRSLSHVIVDEIHALCPNKRGVFLALLLERLEAINPRGLRPDRPVGDAAAAGRGGPLPRRPARDDGRRRRGPVRAPAGDDRRRRASQGARPGGHRPLRPRRAAGRGLDLAGDRAPAAGPDPRASLDDRLRQQPPDRRAADGPPERPGRRRTRPRTTTPRVVARAHHGSLSLDERRETEEALKEGELPAVVATASLELGIDMGAVDLVCQVESPGSVARGLQRVGRAGHVVGRSSKGRLIAKTSGDLLESAALCRAMLARRGRGAPGADQLPRRPGAAGRRLRGGRRLDGPRAVRPRPRGLSVPRPARLGLRGRAEADLRAGSRPRPSATSGPG